MHKVSRTSIEVYKLAESQYNFKTKWKDIIKVIQTESGIKNTRDENGHIIRKTVGDTNNSLLLEARKYME